MKSEQIWMNEYIVDNEPKEILGTSLYTISTFKTVAQAPTLWIKFLVSLTNEIIIIV